MVQVDFISCWNAIQWNRQPGYVFCLTCPLERINHTEIVGDSLDIWIELLKLITHHRTLTWMGISVLVILLLWLSLSPVVVVWASCQPYALRSWRLGSDWHNELSSPSCRAYPCENRSPRGSPAFPTGLLNGLHIIINNPPCGYSSINVNSESGVDALWTGLSSPWTTWFETTLTCVWERLVTGCLGGFGNYSRDGWGCSHGVHRSHVLDPNAKNNTSLSCSVRNSISGTVQQLFRLQVSG